MRTLNAAAQALHARLKAGENIPTVDLLYMGFTVPQRYAIGGMDRVLGGNTWTALDIAIGAVKDSTTTRAGLKLSFPGVTSPQLALALSGDPEGTPLRIYVGLVDPTTGVVEDAMLVWSGAIDAPGWQDGAEATVNFTAEHLMDIAMRPRPSRYTNTEQRRLHPGDTFFDFDRQTDTAQIVWPTAGAFKV